MDVFPMGFAYNETSHITKELGEEDREGVNVSIKRRHKRRPRRRRQGERGIQRGKGKLTRPLKTGLSLLKRLAKGKIGKKVTKKVRGKAITYGPSLYEKGVSMVKNRRVRNVLNSNFAYTALTYSTAFGQDRLNRY